MNEARSSINARTTVTTTTTDISVMLARLNPDEGIMCNLGCSENDSITSGDGSSFTSDDVCP